MSLPAGEIRTVVMPEARYWWPRPQPVAGGRAAGATFFELLVYQFCLG